MDALESTARTGGIYALNQDDKALIVDALEQLISLSRDELTNQKIKGDSTVQPLRDRLTQLPTQIEKWQQLLQKLGQE